MLFSSASAVRQAKSTGLRKRSCFSGRACQRSTATKQGRASPSVNRCDRSTLLLEIRDELPHLFDLPDLRCSDAICKLAHAWI